MSLISRVIFRFAIECYNQSGERRKNNSIERVLHRRDSSFFRSGLESGAFHFSNASHYSSRRFLLTSLREKKGDG